MMLCNNVYFALCVSMFATACGSAAARSDSEALGPALDMPGTLARGRFDLSDAAGPRFAWPNSAVAAHFRGTELSVRLAESAGQTDGASSDNLYDVVVDRQTPTVLTAKTQTATYPLASNLTMGEHTVWLIKRTESSVGAGQLLGFDVGDGELLAPPVTSDRHIEFVGDGEFTGAGAVATAHWYDMCKFSASTEDAQVSVPKVVSDQLDADFTNVSATGKGLLQNTEAQDLDTLPEVYERSLAQEPNSVWDFARWDASVVVVDAGMADLTGDSGSATLHNWDGFVQSYTGLVRNARQHYPHAAILCAIPAAAHDEDRQTLQDAIGEAVSGLQQGGDARVWTFDYFAGDSQYHSYNDLANDAGVGWGCDYHPSEAGAKILAQRLGDAIKTRMNW